MSEQKSVCHPGTAAVLSFLFNGLGQIYNGEIHKGLFLIFLSAITMTLMIIGSILIILWLLGKVISIYALFSGLILFVSGIIAICVLGIYSILDAYNTAAKK